MTERVGCGPGRIRRPPLVQASGIDPTDQLAVRRWLKAQHGVPQNSQWAIADAAARAAGWVPPGTAEYVDSQYRGAKAGLQAAYDQNG